MRNLGRAGVLGCMLALGGVGAVAAAVAGDANPSPPAPAATSATATATAGAARPALWRTFDMIVNLQNLPRTYTCDELWYELHGILLQLGAWPYSINILPYHCSPAPNGTLRSPDVQVGFQLPFFLHGAAAKSAPAQAVERSIRLSPGAPKTLHAADCQLMQQLSQTLLSSLPLRIDRQHFDCSGPPRRAADFQVTVTLPVAVKERTVATSAPVPR